MQEILEEILACDLLILSFPLYCYGMPAPLKAVMDRILPLTSMKMEKTDDERYVHPTQADISHLQFMMICGCGFPNSKQNFEPAVMQFNLMFRGNNTVITVPESPMFNAPEASAVTFPKLELIKRAGTEYAKNGSIPETLLAEIISPMIPEDVYAKIINGG
jgi:multimeric flavodoxin WrbA